MVTVVTVMDQEKSEKLFNPQNTNGKPAENSKALLAFTQHRKIQIYTQAISEKQGSCSQIPERFIFFPLSNIYKIQNIYTLFSPNIAISVLLHLLYNHCKTKKKILVPTSERGEEQCQNGYTFHLKGGEGREGAQGTPNMLLLVSTMAGSHLQILPHSSYLFNNKSILHYFFFYLLHVFPPFLNKNITIHIFIEVNYTVPKIVKWLF